MEKGQLKFQLPSLPTDEVPFHRKAYRPLVDLKGLKVGSLTVLFEVASPDPKWRRWRCVCDCGTLVGINHRRLKDRNAPHIACHVCLAARNRSLAFGTLTRMSKSGDIHPHYWNRVKQAAKSRELEFTVDVGEAWTIFLAQGRRCALSGEALEFASTARSHQTASLDRIDSTKGYVSGNVQWVHKWVNIMKTDMTDPEFVEWCKRVVKYSVDKRAPTPHIVPEDFEGRGGSEKTSAVVASSGCAEPITGCETPPAANPGPSMDAP